MRKLGIAALAAVTALVGCSEVQGTVTGKTDTAPQCSADPRIYAVVIDTGQGVENRRSVCVSRPVYQKYNVGDSYP